MTVSTALFGRGRAADSLHYESLRYLACLVPNSTYTGWDQVTQGDAFDFIYKTDQNNPGVRNAMHSQ